MRLATSVRLPWRWICSGSSRASRSVCAQAQLGRHLAQRPPEQRFGRGTEELRHGRVHRVDALLQVHRHHAVGELAQHGVEPLALGEFDAADAGHLDGVVEGLAHRVLRVQEHPHHAGLVGEVGDQARGHHRLGAQGLELAHHVAGVLFRGVGALHDAEAEQAVELLHLVGHVAVGHEGDARGHAARAAQRPHHVEAAHLHQHHRHVELLAQEGAAGPGGHHHVGRARAQLGHGLVEALVEHLDVGHGLVHGRQACSRPFRRWKPTATMRVSLMFHIEHKRFIIETIGTSQNPCPASAFPLKSSPCARRARPGTPLALEDPSQENPA